MLALDLCPLIQPSQMIAALAARPKLAIADVGTRVIAKNIFCQAVVAPKVSNSKL